MSGKPQAPGFDGDRVHPQREYVVGCNVGLRRWYVMDFDKPLRSISWHYYWEGRGPHTSRDGGYQPLSQWGEGYPQLGNGIGFYGYYVKDAYVGYSDNAKYRIGGMVEGYGRTVVGTRGFRSEKAVILAFDLSDLADVAYSLYGLAGSQPTPSERATLREYLERHYPTVPIFENSAEMLALIPLSKKPEFTRYEGKQNL